MIADALDWGPTWTAFLIVSVAVLIWWRCRPERARPLSEVEAYRNCHERGRHPWE